MQRYSLYSNVTLLTIVFLIFVLFYLLIKNMLPLMHLATEKWMNSQLFSIPLFSKLWIFFGSHIFYSTQKNKPTPLDWQGLCIMQTHQNLLIFFTVEHMNFN